MYFYVCLLCSVCLNITDSQIRISMMEANITDKRSGYTDCMMDGFHCLFECTVTNSSWINGSSVCLEANVTKYSTKIVYSLQQCKYTFCGAYS